jgi:hypothetical protein
VRSNGLACHADANCTSWLVNEVCYSDDDEHENKWCVQRYVLPLVAAVSAIGFGGILKVRVAAESFDNREKYMDDLACLMDGTWFSTDAAGECPSSGKTDDCWWRVVETRRTVNQSCVDDRVVSAVKQARGPGCWNACPLAERNNVTSACWISCFFDTMLGTGSQAQHGPMDPADIAKAFSNSFLEDGGCAVVVPPSLPNEGDTALGDIPSRAIPWHSKSRRWHQ